MNYPQAYADGYTNGRTDRRLGQRPDYAWAGVDLDPPGTYSWWYSRGYRAAWRPW